jgi:ribosomal protein S10
MRSYSVRNLEFFADFAMRAAYYLKLPAYGPVPLPRIVERWTVPKGSFIHKKSQENFERKTLRRLIQIKDGEADTVQIWLAFLKKHAYYGIGMKANIWEFSKLGKFFSLFRRGILGDKNQANEKIDVGKQMDLDMEEMRGDMEETLGSFAMKRKANVQDKIIDLINRGDFRANSGGSAGMMPTNYMNEQNQ